MRLNRHHILAALVVCGIATLAACSKKEAAESSAAKGADSAASTGVQGGKDKEYLETAKTFVQKVMNEADIAYMEAHVAEDYVDHTPAPGQEPTREGLKNLLVALKTGFPDLKVEGQEFIVKDNRVSMRLRMTGTHTGRFAGLAPTGKKIDCTSYDVAGINEQGKVSEHWGAVDMLTLLSQLGVTSGLSGISIANK